MKRSVEEQFEMDGTETKGNALAAERIENVCQMFKKNSVKVGDVIVSSHFSAKGGNLEIRKIVELEDEEWEGYGNYLSTVSLETAIIIEHPEYRSKDVQPYNRQQPFYIPSSFDSLNKETVEDWNLYYSNESQSRITFGVREFYHNNFWDTVQFSVVLEKEDLSRFLRVF